MSPAGSRVGCTPCPSLAGIWFATEGKMIDLRWGSPPIIVDDLYIKMIRKGDLAIIITVYKGAIKTFEIANDSDMRNFLTFYKGSRQNKPDPCNIGEAPTPVGSDRDLLVYMAEETDDGVKWNQVVSDNSGIIVNRSSQ
jgi:hypothetical protein